MQRWQWAVLLGALSLILGVVALAFPLPASLSVVLFTGWAFLFVGALQMFSAFRDRAYGEMVWGLITLVLGVMLLARPLDGMIALTVAVGALFVISGLFRLFAGFRLRHRLRWVVLLSGAASLLLGVAVLAGFPGSAAVTLGLLMAVELIFVGSGLIVLGLAKRP